MKELKSLIEAEISSLRAQQNVSSDVAGHAIEATIATLKWVLDELGE